MANTGCALCEPWPPPPECCKDVCDNDSGAEGLFELWWEAVVPWAWEETCGQFGVCDVEVAPCPPCGCPSVCKCGPWDTIDLSKAFGPCPVVLGPDGSPLIEFRFPLEDGTVEVLPWERHGVFSIRPDMHTVDFCEPLWKCSGWPDSDCGQPWTIAARVGREPPALLVNSLGAFVCEIVKDCLGQDSCLPDGVTSITRRGLSMDIDQGPSETIRFDTKNTGVPLLDLAFRRWGDCESPLAMVDPLARRDSVYRKVWTFRSLWPATPVGAE